MKRAIIYSMIAGMFGLGMANAVGERIVKDRKDLEGMTLEETRVWYEQRKLERQATFNFPTVTGTPILEPEISRDESEKEFYDTATTPAENHKGKKEPKREVPEYALPEFDLNEQEKIAGVYKKLNDHFGQFYSDENASIKAYIASVAAESSLDPNKVQVSKKELSVGLHQFAYDPKKADALRPFMTKSQLKKLDENLEDERWVKKMEARYEYFRDMIGKDYDALNPEDNTKVYLTAMNDYLKQRGMKATPKNMLGYSAINQGHKFDSDRSTSRRIALSHFNKGNSIDM